MVWLFWNLYLHKLANELDPGITNGQHPGYAMNHDDDESNTHAEQETQWRQQQQLDHSDNNNWFTCL